MTRKLRALFASAFLLLWAGGASAGMVVLDADDANGIGDNGGSPFLFSFSSEAPSFKGALLELLDYDALAIAVTDGEGFALLPEITFSPGQSILFSFDGTAAGMANGYTAHVVGVGSGAFGLEIQAVPIPAAMVLFGSALALFGLVGRGRKAVAANA